MKYRKIEIQKELSIGGIYSLRYHEYIKDFRYGGERHPFWELVYADKKSFSIIKDGQEIVINTGEAYIIEPDVFHALKCNGLAANAFIMSFECDSQKLYSISDKPMLCNTEQRRLIGNIVHRAQKVFNTPIDVRGGASLELNPGCRFGEGQLLVSFIEQLLVSLIHTDGNVKISDTADGGRLFDEVCFYLENNVSRKLNFDEILKQFNVSASVLKRVFRAQAECGVMEYFNKLKIETAKQMIREGERNFTEIALKLSFNTSQYFTTVFKRISGMTPSEYEASVKSKYTEDKKYDNRQ